MNCPTCQGGEDLVFEIAPNWTQKEVTTIGNRVIIPRSLRPENICFDKLYNVSVDMSDPAELTDTTAPLFFDATPNADGTPSCVVRAGDWPCPVQVIDWDVTTKPEPTIGDDPDDDLDDCSCDLGTITMFREVTAGCITHMCVDGDLHCFPQGGGGGTVSGTPIDTVCYDFDGVTFPTSFGGGSGSWDIYGVNVLDDPCSSGPANFVPSDLDFACWGDWGGLPGPTASNGWNSLNWVPDSGVFPQNTNFPPEIMATDVSHGCSRPAFRVNPGFTSGTSGPFTVQINFTDPGGNTRWAMYDTLTGQQIPAEILFQTPGGTMEIESGPNGLTVFAPSGGTPGVYIFEFDPPPGVNSSNLRFVAWNMGNGDGSGTSPAESFTIDQITGIPSTSNCCIPINDIGSVAALMNSRDTGGSGTGWIVAGTRVCNTFPSGIGPNYEGFETCDFGPIFPSIESTTSTGGGSGSGCPNCVTVVQNSDGTVTANQTPAANVTWDGRCGVTSSGGWTATASGMFFDGCAELDATPFISGDKQTWLETNYPPSEFMKWWRQGFEFTDGSSVWVVVNEGSTLRWKPESPET